MRWRKLRYLLPSVRRESDRDIQEELQSLAEMASPCELGNLTLAAEDARAAWGWNWLSSFWTDVRYGFRTLVNKPGFLAATVLTLALGVGANTAIFSLINATILRRLGVFGTVCAVLLSVALVASFIPAHRAAGLDPVQALRRE